MNKVLLSLSVVIRNEERQIQNFLSDNFLAFGGQMPEIIFVDNNSSDMTCMLIDEWVEAYPNLKIQLIRRTSNNMAEARNQALRAANTEWVYFIDADCRLTETGWRQVLNIFEDNRVKDPKVVAVGGGNIPPDETNSVSDGLRMLAKSWWGHMNAIQVKPPESIQPVNLLSSCNLLVKRDLALAVAEPFDPFFEKVGEDLSFSIRMRSSGYKLLAVPGIEVIHLQCTEMKPWLDKMFGYGQAQVRVASQYPSHFRGVRGLQCFVVLWFAFLMIVAFPVALIIGLIYCLAVLVSFKDSRPISLHQRLKGTAFIAATQGAYALGELWAVLQLPKSLLSRSKQ